MNGCENIQMELCEYLDGELSAQDAQRVELHLKGCAACQAEAARLNEAISAVKALPRRAAPASILTKVRAGMKTTAAPQRAPNKVVQGNFQQFMQKYALSAVALVMVGVTLTWALKVSNQSTDSVGSATPTSEVSVAKATVSKSVEAPQSATRPNAAFDEESKDAKRDEAGEQRKGVDKLRALEDGRSGGIAPKPQATLAGKAEKDGESNNNRAVEKQGALKANLDAVNKQQQTLNDVPAAGDSVESLKKAREFRAKGDSRGEAKKDEVLALQENEQRLERQDQSKALNQLQAEKSKQAPGNAAPADQGNGQPARTTPAPITAPVPEPPAHAAPAPVTRAPASPAPGAMPPPAPPQQYVGTSARQKTAEDEKLSRKKPEAAAKAKADSSVLDDQLAEGSRRKLENAKEAAAPAATPAPTTPAEAPKLAAPVVVENAPKAGEEFKKVEEADKKIFITGLPQNQPAKPAESLAEDKAGAKQGGGKADREAGFAADPAGTTAAAGAATPPVPAEATVAPQGADNELTMLRFKTDQQAALLEKLDALVQQEGGTLVDASTHTKRAALGLGGTGGGAGPGGVEQAEKKSAAEPAADGDRGVLDGGREAKPAAKKWADAPKPAATVTPPPAKGQVQQADVGVRRITLRVPAGKKAQVLEELNRLKVSLAEAKPADGKAEPKAFGGVPAEREKAKVSTRGTAATKEANEVAKNPVANTFEATKDAAAEEWVTITILIEPIN